MLSIMDIVKLVLFGFGVNQSGDQFAMLQVEPLIGESKESQPVTLRKGDTLTIQAPIEPREPEGDKCWCGTSLYCRTHNGPPKSDRPNPAS